MQPFSVHFWQALQSYWKVKQSEWTNRTFPWPWKACKIVSLSDNAQSADQFGSVLVRSIVYRIPFYLCNNQFGSVSLSESYFLCGLDAIFYIWDKIAAMRNNEQGYDLDSAIRELERITHWRPRKAVRFSPDVEKFFMLKPRYWSQDFADDFTLVNISLFVFYL